MNDFMLNIILLKNADEVLLNLGEVSYLVNRSITLEKIIAIAEKQRGEEEQRYANGNTLSSTHDLAEALGH